VPRRHQEARTRKIREIEFDGRKEERIEERTGKETKGSERTVTRTMTSPPL